MYYIVALGNPGQEYEQTRHNVGFSTLDFIIESFGLSKPNKSSQYSGLITQGLISGQEVSLLYPDTFMNHSGNAIKKLVPKEEVSKLIVLYDDIALPLGKIKLSFDRGDGGHNGIKSIISSMGSKDFIRVRIGIGPTSFWTGKIKPMASSELANFVLSKFSRSEQSKLKSEVFVQVKEAVKQILEEGYVKAMNTWN